jgi:molybdopterin converting factor subunit 1
MNIVVELKLFASCREIAGISSCNITLTPPQHSVMDLINNVLEQFPDLADSVSELSIAVNKKYITEKDHLLSDNDIVAFIPPISGG